MKLHTFLTAAKAVHPIAEFACHVTSDINDECTLIDVRLPIYSSSIGKHAAVVDVDANGIIEDWVADSALKKIAETALDPDVVRTTDRAVA
jgi:hypothetical protein